MLTDVKLWDVENGSTSQHLASLKFLENWISKISNRFRKKLGINMSKTGHPRDLSGAFMSAKAGLSLLLTYNGVEQFPNPAFPLQLL